MRIVIEWIETSQRLSGSPEMRRSGHCPHVSRPDEVAVEIIDEIAVSSPQAG